MKNQFRTILKVTAVVGILSLFISSCKDEDSEPGPSFTGESKTYTLSSVSNPAISGTVKFSETDDNATVVTINLIGTTSSNTYVAHIHENSAAETGGIIIDLNSFNDAGKSETLVTEMNNGTAISYDELLSLNGYTNVHLSATNITTLIAQGDIGENELTTTSTTYSLMEVNGSGISGSVKFAKRVSGSTLVTVDLDGTSPAGNYPIHIYDNDIATQGPVAINLNNYNGATGVSETSVRKLNNNTPISYDQLRDFNGHLNVGTSATNGAYVAQGNIGSN